MNGENICIVCNTENEPGAMRCRKCYAPLRSSDTTMNVSDPFTLGTREFKPYKDALTPGTIAVRVLGEHKSVQVTVEDEFILGRVFFDATQHLVDSSDHHRVSLLGVSRQHAVIRPDEKGYIIEDLGSTNGTRVNTERLLPGQPRALNSGDQVQLGELILFVSFVPHE